MYRFFFRAGFRVFLGLCLPLHVFAAALSLDGNGDYVTFVGTGVPSGNAPFTTEAWVNPDVHSDSMITFWGIQSGNRANGFRLMGGGRTRHFFWSNDHDTSSMGDISSNTSGPNNDGWHHLAITFDGTQTQWYWNGAPLEGPRTANGVNVAFANHRIGNRLNAEYWDGLIDEVRIWNVARTAAEIAGDWDSGLAGTEPNLVAYFPFENEYVDEAGGNNTGTAVGNAFVAATENAPVITSGPRIVQFEAAPSGLFDRQGAELSWEIDESQVSGNLHVEITDGSNVVLVISSLANGSANVVVTNTTREVEQQTYTLRAGESGGGMVERTATVVVTVDPGIPVADSQNLATVNTNNLAITLTASDPDAAPQAELTYSIVDPPEEGALSGTPPDLIYLPDAGFVGEDTFQFTASDGRWESLPQTIRINSLAPPQAPTDILLSTPLISDGTGIGTIVALLFSVDLNPEDTHSYTLVAGIGDSDNQHFTINADQLIGNADFSVLIGSTLTIRVRSSDSGGQQFERILNLSVIAVPIHPVINEVHYNPTNNTVREEFVELYNPGVDPIDLTGYRISGAIDYAFTNGPVLLGDSYLVIAQDPAVLSGSPLGPYAGGLSSEGETIRLRDTLDQVVDEVDYQPGFPWPVAANGEGFSLQLIHPNLDNELGSSWRSAVPSPGAINAIYALNAAPSIRQVNHLPQQPGSIEPIVISAKVTDPAGVQSVLLEYQVVLPGAYIPAHLPHPFVNRRIPDYALPRELNPAYTNLANWTSQPMTYVGNERYAVTLPPVQTNRTLIRYRITVTDQLNESIRVPYPDDPALNFACFVYDGVPDYHGHSATNLTGLPVYHVLSRSSDWSDCYAWNDTSKQIIQGTGNEDRFLYNWNGSMVYEGEVYDNIRYRLRGANGRYHQNGKRSMRFRMNKGSYFQARDQEGKKFKRKWRTLTTGKGFENRGTLTYALNERINMYLWDKVGLPAQKTFWAHLRVIDDAAEAPDQWRGDFWGLTYVLETYDRRFLDQHGLPDGNLYKLINQERDALRQQRYQAPFAPQAGEDHDTIENTLTGFSGEATIRAHVDLDKYYLYHSFSEAIRNYDFWPSANKNMVYYFYPDYSAANSYQWKLWILPWDSDATWGPTWHSGHDVVHNMLFNDAVSNGGDTGTTPALWPGYYNAVRELRDLLWQPDQIEPVIDHFASVITPIIGADTDRWKNAPADAGSYGSLGGAGGVSLTALVNDMKAFAFSGGRWPGDGGTIISRAAHLDELQASNGQGPLIPHTPTISYTGTPGFPVNGLRFQSSSFSDPQGNQTFGAMEWQLAEMNAPFNLEIDPTWESGIYSNFISDIELAAYLVETGRSYRARVRHQDATGIWSHWSPPVAFVPSLPDLSDYINGLVVSEIMYHPPEGTAYEWIELLNIGPISLDLRDVRFTKGVDFDFAGSAVTNLAAGEYVVVVNDLHTFTNTYGAGLNVAGEWEITDNLADGGERVKLSFGAGETLRDFEYGDDFPWPKLADGRGASLTLIAPETLPEHAVPENWRASVFTNGSPGRARQTTAFNGNPADDMDGDDLGAFAEHALGLSEANPDDAALALTISRERIMTYPRNLRADDAGVLLELSEDLTTWFYDPGAMDYRSSRIENGVEWTELTPRDDNARYYGRLKIVPRQ